MQKTNISNGKKSGHNQAGKIIFQGESVPNFCPDLWQVDVDDYETKNYQSQNLTDQDDVNFYDEQIEDVIKITDDEYFDFLEQEKYRQKVQKAIDKVIGEK